MPRFLLPIEGLDLSDEWQVGTVRLHTAAAARELVGQQGRNQLDHPVIGEHTRRVLDGLVQGSALEVEADNLEIALDLAQDAVDVLRVFREMRREWRGGHFGLPGTVAASRVEYLVLGSSGGPGFKHRGQHLGTSLDEGDALAWADSDGIRVVGELVGRSGSLEGETRAMTAVRLLSLAVGEHRPQMKLLSVVMAVDALLGRDQRAFQLARRTAYFTCDIREPSMCGRDKPTCPYLALDPGTEFGHLKRLRKRSEVDLYWRCSEWFDMLARYDARSAVVHGGHPGMVTPETASRAEYWAIHVLLEPVLEWLMNFRKSPMTELEFALSSLPPMPDWEALAPDRKRERP